MGHHHPHPTPALDASQSFAECVDQVTTAANCYLVHAYRCCNSGLLGGQFGVFSLFLRRELFALLLIKHSIPLFCLHSLDAPAPGEYFNPKHQHLPIWEMGALPAWGFDLRIAGGQPATASLFLPWFFSNTRFSVHSSLISLKPSPAFRVSFWGKHRARTWAILEGLASLPLITCAFFLRLNHSRALQNPDCSISTILQAGVLLRWAWEDVNISCKGWQKKHPGKYKDHSVFFSNVIIFPYYWVSLNTCWLNETMCWCGVMTLICTPLRDCREIQPVNLKGNKSWIFIGRADSEAEMPILWPPDAKNWLTGKDQCWERLKVGGEGDDRGWDGWMASPTWWTWVWVSSGSWRWTGKPGMLQFMGSQSWTWLSDWTELKGLVWGRSRRYFIVSFWKEGGQALQCNAEGQNKGH